MSLSDFFATFLYNYVANVLRGIEIPSHRFFFLGISVILNIFLDLYFVLVLHMGIKGAAVATVIAQYVSGVGILLYFLVRYPEYHISRNINASYIAVFALYLPASFFSLCIIPFLSFQVSCLFTIPALLIEHRLFNRYLYFF